MTRRDIPTPFSLDGEGARPLLGEGAPLALSAAARLLSLGRLEHLYRLAAGGDEPLQFLDRVLAELGVSLELPQGAEERIPAKGPVLVAANHPFGAVEGMLLARWLLTIRPDVKLMANYLLGRIPELRGLFVLVDPFDQDRQVSGNLGPLRQCIRHVESGGLLAMFPAGEVAHLRLSTGRITEPAWSTALSLVAGRSGAPVVPVYFRGKNGPLFQLLGLAHPRLRTAMLPRELHNKRGARLRAEVGSAIAAERYRGKGGHAGAASYLRARTLLLGRRRPPGRRQPAPDRAKSRPMEPVAQPRDLELAALDVATLPPGQVLIESGPFQVVYAHRRQIPSLIREVGRLRELSFRQVGEGTGKASDLDKFDDYYLQLCLFNRETGELAGGYRLGLADEILARRGVAGLYTSTLFRFEPGFFRAIPGCMEMGRSFVAPEYQRSYSALLLLWKGIGRFILRHPQVRHLFGPVTVSDRYRLISRRLMRDYLDRALPSELAPLVAARRPPRLAPGGALAAEVAAGLASFEELSEVVADLEPDGKGAPILFKQYLKLGARCAGWNLDPEFGDAIDALFVVDLMQADPKTLGWYCGREGAAAWRALHADGGPRLAAGG